MGPITRIASGCTAVEVEKIEAEWKRIDATGTFRVHAAPSTALENGRYKYSNKPGGLLHFLTHASLDADYVGARGPNQTFEMARSRSASGARGPPRGRVAATGAGRIVGVAIGARRARTAAQSGWRPICDSSPQNIHVAAAAPPRLVSSEYPRRSRGAAAMRQRNNPRGKKYRWQKCKSVGRGTETRSRVALGHVTASAPAHTASAPSSSIHAQTSVGDCVRGSETMYDDLEGMGPGGDVDASCRGDAAAPTRIFRVAATTRIFCVAATTRIFHVAAPTRILRVAATTRIFVPRGRDISAQGVVSLATAIVSAYISARR